MYRIQIDYRKSGSEILATDEIHILPPGRYERDLPDALQEVWIKSAEGWIKERAEHGRTSINAAISTVELRSGTNLL